MIPGEVLAADRPVGLNVGRDRIELRVLNVGDRPVQVGSHYHFGAVNPALDFDRAAARGYRLDVPAGTSVRFEPGMSLTVSLVALAGRRTVPGLRPEYACDLDAGDAVAGDADAANGDAGGDADG